jgi:hypothetical protein
MGGKMQATFKRKAFRDARKLLNDLCLMLDGKEASSNRNASQTPNPDGAQAGCVTLGTNKRGLFELTHKGNDLIAAMTLPLVPHFEVGR